jgi:septum formation inhibitor MinC
MIIYSAEAADGLSEKLHANACVSYASLALKAEPLNKSDKANIKSLASLNDKDLYYVQSILVSSSWNKNDDIFDKDEVWAARKTPEDKPTNLEHDESTIIGHITANWPITEDGTIIDESTEAKDLPEKYHILTGSVIYTGFSSPDLRDRALNLISEIESGNKYVSMECFFQGFDYGLLNSATGEYTILPRNESTAHLTKYLRAYGGLGEHQNYKIGRVLRDITFSGKGFVNKPANPDSIIFNSDNLKVSKAHEISISDHSNNIDLLKDNHVLSNLEEKNTDFGKIGVINNHVHPKENITMSSETQVENVEQTAESSNELSEALTLVASLKDQLAQAQQALAEKDAQLEEYLNKTQATDEDLKKIQAQLDETVAREAATIEQMKADLAAAEEVIAGYKIKEEEMAKKEKKMKRVAELMEAGLDNETAVSSVEKFEALDDASFDGVKTLLAAVKKAPLTKEEKDVEEDKEETKSSVVLADESVLETVETEQTADLSVGGEIEESESSTRAALVDFVYNRLGKKPHNKGE